MRILACDAGSSSFKAALYGVEDVTGVRPADPQWRGQTSWRSSEATEQRESAVTRLLQGAAATAPHVIAHRIVHGGKFRPHHLELTPEVEADISRASAQAPDHNPIALLGLAVTRKLFPGCKQVAVFDSVFHATMPEAAVTYAAPLAWKDIWGMRRLGFHGLSHRYCAERASELSERDLKTTAIVTCHLGNGCSLAAVKGGRSIDTTMGWTPLEGVAMGQRCGDIDPGILMHLLARDRYSVGELQRVLNEESGLRGLSGLSGDMREIIAAAGEGQPRPKLALAVYVHRLRKAIGGMIAALGGIDALTFTGGVGENALAVRAAVCADFAWCGIQVDDERNKSIRPDANIAAPKAKVAVFVVKSEEAWQMARECYALEERYVS